MRYSKKGGNIEFQAASTHNLGHVLRASTSESWMTANDQNSTRDSHVLATSSLQVTPFPSTREGSVEVPDSSRVLFRAVSLAVL